MSRAFASQWIKLRRRAVLLSTLAACAGFALLATVLSITTAQEQPQADAPGFEVITPSELARASGLAQGLEGASQFLGIVALVVFAHAIASEYSLGTIRSLLVREPRRFVLLGGSWLALVTLAAGAAVLAGVVSVLAAFAVAPGAGIDTSAWSSAEGWGAVASGIANAALAMAGYGTLGVALAIALRSPAAAIGVGVAYALPFESIVAGAVDGSERWLPGQLLAALARSGTDAVGYGHAVLVLAIYAVVVAGVCAQLVRRRDVTV